MGGFGHSAVLRTLPLSGSLNKVYTAHFVRPNSAYGGTSYTPKTLYAITPAFES